VSAAVLRTDGGSRGNPGPAGAGFVIEVADEIVCRGGKFITSATNNVAEYEAFIWGLENVSALGHRNVTVYADSELLVKQVNGQYRVKNEGLKPLFTKALKLLRGFSSFKVAHVRREQNVDADEMANQAMDARATVGDPACEPGGAGTAQSSLF
jgi:ribonuclease HI